MIKKKHIISTLAFGGMLLTGCSEDTLLNGDNGNILPEGGMGKITFSIGLENYTGPFTRVTNDGDEVESHIGKGEMIDELICAIYMADEESGNYDIDPPLHPVQTVIPVDFTDNKRMEFTVDNLMADKTYYIAFWAQNSGSDAYDTSDLRCVEVKYTDAEGNNFVNNDESRDAFCNVWKGSINTESSYFDITLHRPLSQINVGTTGADYNNILQGPYVFPNLRITHSMVRVQGVARFMSVTDDRILLQDDMEAIGRNPDDAFTDVTFDWAALPAFMYMDGIPTDNASLLESPDEEFLRVELNGDDSIEGYLTSYPTIDADNNYLTETFKYLSMCYVLAPATSSGSTVFEKITVGFAEDATGTHGANTINVSSAKAGRNYRTNILGGLLFVNIPDDPTPTPPDEPTPDDPVDPTPDDPVDPTPDDPVDPTPDDPVDPTPDDPVDPTPDDPEDPTPTPPDDPTPPSILTSTMDFNFIIQTDYMGGHNVDKDGNELK